MRSSKSLCDSIFADVIIFSLIISVCVAAAYPALSTGAMLRGHDFGAHLLWQINFSQVLAEGTLYPRWLPGHNLGFGSPAFFIYPPLPQFITSLLMPFGEDPADAALRLAVSSALARIIGGLGIYWWLRSHTSRLSACIAALAYVLAPYHLAIDVYVRAAFAELWAFAWPPYALLAIDRLRSRPITGLVLLVLAIAATLLTHAPSALIVIPVMGLYALVNAVAARDAATLARFVIASLLALLLCAPYLVTMVTHLRHIPTTCLFGEYFTGQKWLFGRSPWPNDVLMMPFIVTAVAQAGVGAMALILGLAATRRRPPGYVFFAALVLVVSTFMTTTLSTPIWDLDTLLSMIQFPWRILTLQVLALAALVGFGLASLSARRSAWSRVAFVSLLAGVGAVAAANYVVMRELTLVPLQAASEAPRQAREMAQQNIETCEYRVGEAEAMASRFADNARTIVLNGEGTASAPYWKSRRILVDTEAATDMVIGLRQAQYSGWRYRISNGVEGVTQAFSDSEPFITLRVPAGRHLTEIILPTDNAERTGWWLALAGVLLTIVSAVVLRRRTPERR